MLLKLIIEFTDQEPQHWCAHTVTSDLEPAIANTILQIDVVPLHLDTMHTCRNKSRKHKKIEGSKFLNLLKKIKISGYYTLYHQYFAIKVMDPEYTFFLLKLHMNNY